ncbi:MAG TPA: DsbA family protein, partial [Phenylobacterium sp.]|uniref:DsbA family protein n=1 Tax=Phenylobacterium sp. TaxID=1871053 RepID=UPI002CB75FFC
MRPALAMLAAAAALSLAGCQKADDAVFGQRVRAYLLAHPEVIREAVQKLQDNEQAAAAKASTAALKTYRSQIERDPRDIVIHPQGKVTVTEFFDYRCGYCKLAAPEVVKLIDQNPDIRFVFKQFPIFGAVSDTAAKVALTPQGKAKAFDLYKSWMGEKALDDTLLDKDLQSAGIDPAAARKAAESPAIEQQILDTRALASNLKIEGTPAFVVGDTLIPGADMPALRAAITVAKDGGLRK